MWSPFTESVLENLDEGLVVVDRNHLIVRWSGAMQALTSIPASHAIGRPVAEVTKTLGGLDLGRGLHLALAGEATRVDDVAAGTRYLGVRCVPLRDESGGVAGAAAFVSDVTGPRRRAVLLRAIEAIGRSLTSALDLDEVLDTIALRALDVMGAEGAVVAWWDQPRSVFRVMRAVGRLDTYAAGDELPVGGGPGSVAVLQSRAVTTSNVLADPAFHIAPERRRQIEREGYQAVAAAPLTAKGRIYGTLIVHYWSERTFTEEDRRALVVLAEHAALAIDGAQLFGEATRRAERLRELAEVERLVVSSLELSEVLAHIAQSTARLVGVPMALVWTAEPGARAIHLSAISVEPGIPQNDGIPPTLRFGQGIGGRVAETRRRILVDDVRSDQRVVAGEWAARVGLTSLLSVPIEAGDTLLGVLTVAGRAGSLAAEEDQELVASLAALAGVALQNARVYTQAIGHTRRLQDLVAVSQRISGALDLDELLRMISASAAQLTGARFVAFWLAHDATRTLSFRGGSVPEIAADFPDTTRSYDVGVAGWVARHRQPLDVPDVFEDPRVLPRAWWRRWGLRSFSGHPVMVGDELVAVLSLSHTAPVEFTQEAREVLDLFIAQAGVAIHNARLYRAAQRRRDVAEALARLGRELSGTLDVEPIAQLVARGLVELFGCRNSAVFRLEPRDGTLHVLSWSGADAELLRGLVLAPGEGVAGRAIVERRLLSSRDVLQDAALHLSDDLRARLVRFDRRGIVGAPLVARDQVIGALTLADDARDYTGEELQALQTFADQAALALDNARLYAAARDSLERVRETQAQLVQAGKLSALGQLISGVAHELNNPLSVIIGYGQLLTARDVPASVRRPLEMIVQQGDRMAKIVHNLLYFSRQRPPERTRLDLHEIIERTLALRLNQLSLSGIAVERDLAPDLPVITGDPHQLQQVFLNLVLNAEQAIGGASRKGHILFRTRVDADGATVRASVVDDGPGIPAETLPHVFEPFFTTKDVGAGTGLGLSVSYGIAQEHRGRLTVDSRPGRTVFTLELPVGAPPVVASAAAAAAATEPPTPGGGRRALIVEDEPSVRDFIVVLLEETGWRVDTAGGGRAALAMIRRSAYALIVSDIRMPDGNGEEFYRGAAAHDPALARRFLFITGDTANPAAWAFLERTAVPVLAKPFATDAFLDAVRRVVALEHH